MPYHRLHIPKGKSLNQRVLPPIPQDVANLKEGMNMGKKTTRTKTKSSPWRTVKCHSGLTIRFKTTTKTTTTVEELDDE